VDGTRRRGGRPTREQTEARIRAQIAALRARNELERLKEQYRRAKARNGKGAETAVPDSIPGLVVAALSSPGGVEFMKALSPVVAQFLPGGGRAAPAPAQLPAPIATSAGQSAQPSSGLPMPRPQTQPAAGAEAATAGMASMSVELVKLYQGKTPAEAARVFIASQPPEAVAEVRRVPEGDLVAYFQGQGMRLPALAGWTDWLVRRPDWLRAMILEVRLIGGVAEPPAPRPSELPLLPVHDLPEGTPVSFTSRLLIGQLRGLPPEHAAQWVIGRLEPATVERLVRTEDAGIPAVLAELGQAKPEFLGLLAWIQANADWFAATLAEVRRQVGAQVNGQAAQPVAAQS